MDDGVIDLYFFFSETCEYLCMHSEKCNEKINFSILNSLLLMENINSIFRKIWIHIPGWILTEKLFIYYLHQILAQKEKMHLNSLIIQCNAESITQNITDPIYTDVDLSIIICEGPKCGVERPKRILSKYTENYSKFKTITLVGPSPINCICRFNTGIKIRQSCLVCPNQLFIMSNGTVQICPFGQLPLLGNINEVTFDSIIEKYKTNRMSANYHYKYSSSAICTDCFQEFP